MKSVISLAAAFALFASEASAHYIFQQVSIAGTKHGVFEGVRQNSNYNSPVTGKKPSHPIYLLKGDFLEQFAPIESTVLCS